MAQLQNNPPEVNSCSQENIDDINKRLDEWQLYNEEVPNYQKTTEDLNKEIHSLYNIYKVYKKHKQFYTSCWVRMLPIVFMLKVFADYETFSNELFGCQELLTYLCNAGIQDKNSISLIFHQFPQTVDYIIQGMSNLEKLRSVPQLDAYVCLMRYVELCIEGKVILVENGFLYFVQRMNGINKTSMSWQSSQWTLGNLVKKLKTSDDFMSIVWRFFQKNLSKRCTRRDDSYEGNYTWNGYSCYLNTVMEFLYRDAFLRNIISSTSLKLVQCTICQVMASGIRIIQENPHLKMRIGALFDILCNEKYAGIPIHQNMGGDSKALLQFFITTFPKMEDLFYHSFEVDPTVSEIPVPGEQWTGIKIHIKQLEQQQRGGYIIHKKAHRYAKFLLITFFEEVILEPNMLDIGDLRYNLYACNGRKEEESGLHSSLYFCADNGNGGSIWNMISSGIVIPLKELDFIRKVNWAIFVRNSD